MKATERRTRKPTKVWKWLALLLIASILLAGWIVLEAPLTETRRTNPIHEGTTALKFTPADGGESVFLRDAEAIDRLRDTYRWTNFHTYCCLGEPDDQPVAYVYVITPGLSQAEPLPIFEDMLLPSYSIGFRLLLYRYWQELSTE